MLTILLIALPILMAAAIFILGPKPARMLALVGGIAELLLTLFAAWQLKSGHTELLRWDHDWIGPLGISYAFNLDGISLIMVLLGALLTPIIVYASFNRTFKNPHIFYGLMMLMVGSMLGAFTTTDGLMFYIFYEFALLPIYFMILIWSDAENKARVTLKFFLYTLFGSLFMLLSLLYVYHQAGSFSFTALYNAGQSMSAYEQGMVFAGIFIAFAVKMPIFPFHTWQPSTYDAAPTTGTMLLAAIMLKMATYGLIRLVLPMVPEGVIHYGEWALILSVIGIVYASCMAIVQKRYKLLIAYSSIAHVGMISAGILSGNAQGIQGGLIEMLSHGIVAVGMFFAYDIIESRMKTDEISKLGGIREVNPLFAFLFFVMTMASVALPFTSGFVGEFLLMLGLFQYSEVLTAIAGLTVVLGAVYMLRAFQTMFLGTTNALTATFAPLTAHEKTVLIIIVTLIVFLGVYPSPLLELSETSVETLLLGIH